MPPLRWMILLMVGLFACEDDADSDSPRYDGPQIACREVTYASAFIGEATLLSYEDEPSTAAQCAQRSSTIVRGHLVSVRAGEPSSAPVGTAETDLSALFELEVDKVYKGSVHRGARISLRVP